MSAFPHILVIDDDARALSLFERYLKREGFIVTRAASAREAQQTADIFLVNLILCDVMMPEETGFEFLRRVRSGTTGFNPKIPFILLSALGEGGDRVTGLKAGADDYIVKPPEPEELVLRLNLALRRDVAEETAALSSEKGLLTADGVTLDVNKRLLRMAEAAFALTEAETKILAALLAAPGTPVSRTRLIKLLSTEENAFDTRGADVAVARLRKKIEPDPKKPSVILTVRGEGYVWRG